MFFVLLFGFFHACSLSPFKTKLSSEHSEFFSKVRYIITPEEKKIFKEIPVKERDAFIEEFWKRRDPDPDTEENELKDRYFSRIEESNRLFTAGKPGWLTDRGEVYILLGPPTQWDKYPMGRVPGAYQTRPTEIWYYGLFPIIFVDYQGTGDYVRVEDNVIHLHELNRAMEAARQTLQYEEEFFDYSISFEGKDGEQEFVVKIPYRNIWFKGTKGGNETVLGLSLEVSDSETQVVWDFNQDFHLKFSDEELEEKAGKTFIVRIPVKLEKGKYHLDMTLTNKTGNTESKKSLVFEI